MPPPIYRDREFSTGVQNRWDGSTTQLSRDFLIVLPVSGFFCIVCQSPGRSAPHLDLECKQYNHLATLCCPSVRHSNRITSRAAWQLLERVGHGKRTVAAPELSAQDRPFKFPNCSIQTHFRKVSWLSCSSLLMRVGEPRAPRCSLTI